MKEIYAKIGLLQSECPIMGQETQGYGYTYTSLPEVLRVVAPLLKKHNLVFNHTLNGQSIKCVLVDLDSGQHVESELQIPEVELKGMNKFQALGAAISYFRRYTLCSMLGIISDKDVDASDKVVQNQSSGAKRVAKIAQESKQKTVLQFTLEALAPIKEAGFVGLKFYKDDHFGFGGKFYKCNPEQTAWLKKRAK